MSYEFLFLPEEPTEFCCNIFLMQRYFYELFSVKACDEYYEDGEIEVCGGVVTSIQHLKNDSNAKEAETADNENLSKPDAELEQNNEDKN